MPESENLLQKAFYLGVGMAAYAVETASDKFQELRQKAEKLVNTADFPEQIQKMADEMVSKGKMNAEEARNFVEEMMRQAQPKPSEKNNQDKTSHQPRTIDIITEEDEP